MAQWILQVLQDGEIGALAGACCIAVAILGTGLWLAGARMSRATVTLTLVGVGAVIGLRAPHWFHWKIDGWAPAVVGAVALGASGLLLHRFWVGTGLGLLAALWATFVMCIVRDVAGRYAIPDLQPTMGLRDIAQALWSGVPPDMVRLLPYICGAALLGGVILGVTKPRLTTVLFYSWAGVTLMLCGGLMAINHFKPEWLQSLPPRSNSRAGIVAAAIVFGALLQWTTTPKDPAAPPPAPKKQAGKPRPFVVET